MKKFQGYGMMLLVVFFAVQGVVRAEDAVLPVVQEEKGMVTDNKAEEVVKAPDTDVIPAPPVSDIVKAAEDSKDDE